MKYIDVCMVTVPHGIKNKVDLYAAPPFSFLKAGDDIVVGERVRGVVSGVCTMSTQSQEYAFLLAAFGRTHPLKQISGVYEYKPLFYPEEENG